MKKIFIPLIFSLILNHSVYASNISKVVRENSNLNYEYEVGKEEKDSFIKSLEQEISYEGKDYKLVDYNVKEQNYIDTIEINDIKEIVSNSNSLEDILNMLPKTLNYNNNGYIGINKLDYEDISVTPIYNGYYEEFTDEAKQYFDLTRNDMDFIPKEIKKDGHTLYLINVNWYKQTTKNTGDFEITDLYRAEALYKGVKRINNPFTYKVVAKYSGSAQKYVEKPYLIKVNYEESKLQIEEKEKSNIVLPVTATTTTSIFVILLLIYSSSRVKVYSDKKYLGRYKIKENIIDITNLKDRYNTNNYLIKFNDRLYKKYRGKSIKFIKENISKYCQITSKNIEVKF